MTILKKEVKFTGSEVVLTSYHSHQIFMSRFMSRSVLPNFLPFLNLQDLEIFSEFIILAGIENLLADWEIEG